MYLGDMMNEIEYECQNCGCKYKIDAKNVNEYNSKYCFDCFTKLIFETCEKMEKDGWLIRTDKNGNPLS